MTGSVGHKHLSRRSHRIVEFLASEIEKRLPNARTISKRDGERARVGNVMMMDFF